MTKVTEVALVSAVQQFAQMDSKAKEAVCDDLFKEQPNLLASVLVLTRMSVPPLQVEAVLEVLIVTHLALRLAGVRVATITEKAQEKELERLVASVKFTEGLSSALVEESIQQYVGFREEPYLLAYAFLRLKDSGIQANVDEDAKYLVLSALNVVGCVANAKQVA